MAVTNDDVLYALLALDSYNRHKLDINRKMSDFGQLEFSSKIGKATFQESSDRMELDNQSLDGSQASGFSASYYTIGADNQKLISYRGTDFDFSSVSGALEFLGDFTTGWLTSFNYLNPNSLNVPIVGLEVVKNQPYFAREFYDLVTGAKVFSEPSEGEQPKDTIIVGHSLGGELAGIIGALTENETKIFNEIPYIGVALNMALDAFMQQYSQHGFDIVVLAIQQIVNGEVPHVDGVEFTPFVFPQAGKITSFRMEGEVALFARALGPHKPFFFDEIEGKTNIPADINVNTNLIVDCTSSFLVHNRATGQQLSR